MFDVVGRAICLLFLVAVGLSVIEGQLVLAETLAAYIFRKVGVPRAKLAFMIPPTTKTLACSFRH